MWSLAVSIPSNIAAFYHWVAVKIYFVCIDEVNVPFCNKLWGCLAFSLKVTHDLNTHISSMWWRSFSHVRRFQAGKVLLNWPWLLICLPDGITNLFLSICGLKQLSLECWTQQNMQPCALPISRSTQFFSLASLKAFSHVYMTRFTSI